MMKKIKYFNNLVFYKLDNEVRKKKRSHRRQKPEYKRIKYNYKKWWLNAITIKLKQQCLIEQLSKIFNPLIFINQVRFWSSVWIDDFFVSTAGRAELLLTSSNTSRTSLTRAAYPNRTSGRYSIRSWRSSSTRWRVTDVTRVVVTTIAHGTTIGTNDIYI